MKLPLAVLSAAAVGAGFALSAAAQEVVFPIAKKPHWHASERNRNPANYTDRIIIKLKDAPEHERRQAMSAERAQALSATTGVALQSLRAMSGGAHVMRLPENTHVDEVQALVKRLRADPQIEYAEPDYRRFALAIPNDPRYGQQWNLREEAGGINVEQAWDITQGAANVFIAVLDSGIVPHADVTNRITEGHDFINAHPNDQFRTANDGDGPDADPLDAGDWIDAGEAGKPPFEMCPSPSNSSWHGTHVAGIIGAVTNNALGVAGVNWASPIVPVRVLGKCGGYTSDIADGARWAAGIPNVPDAKFNNGNPVQVINSSLGGGETCADTEQRAIDDVLRQNVKAYVVAAGNESRDAVASSPANCRGVISVAATDRGGNLASYSNFGPLITISAPGGDDNDGIDGPTNRGATAPQPSPGGDSYEPIQGTSEAAPQVAGVVSLMLSANFNLSADQVRDILKSTARPFPNGSNCPVRGCGAGIVDAAAAVAAAQSGIYLSVSPSPVEFPAQAVNTESAAKRLQISNASPAGNSITIGNLSIRGTNANDFPTTSDCFNRTLNPGNSCFVDVSFRPTSQGGKRATLSIPSNAPVTVTFVEIAGGVTSTAPPPAGGGSSNGGGGGGCTLIAHARFDPTLPSLLLLAVGWVMRRAVQHHCSSRSGSLAP